MKICLVSDQLVGYHKTWSGAELVCQQAAKTLQQENQKTIFITAEFNKRDRFQDILQVSTLGSAPSFIKPFFRILKTFGIIGYLKKERPDIVHFFHSNYLFIPVMIAAKILRIPTVFTVLDYFIICSKNNLRMDSGKLCDRARGKHCLGCISPAKFLERFAIRFLLKYFDKIITFTETSKSRLAKYGLPLEKISVIYTFNPFSGTPVKEKGNPAKDSILFVGTFFEYKGLHVVIEAMTRIIARIPNARLRVAGIGYDKDKTRIEKMVGDLDIGNHVEFLGHKKNDEIRKLISENEILVVPEQWPSDFGPLILVEAQTEAKPVVASRIGAIPEFIKDGKNGFLAKHDDPEDFAEKIIRLLEDKPSARKMGERGRADVKSFLERSQRKKVMELYNSLI